MVGADRVEGPAQLSPDTARRGRSSGAAPARAGRCACRRRSWWPGGPAARTAPARSRAPAPGRRPWRRRAGRASRCRARPPLRAQVRRRAGRGRPPPSVPARQQPHPAALHDTAVVDLRLVLGAVEGARLRVQVVEQLLPAHRRNLRTSAGAALSSGPAYQGRPGAPAGRPFHDVPTQTQATTRIGRAACDRGTHRPRGRHDGLRRALVMTTGVATGAVTLLTPATLDAARGPGADVSAAGRGRCARARVAGGRPAAGGDRRGPRLGAPRRDRRAGAGASPTPCRRASLRSTVRIACGLAVAVAPLSGAAVALADPPPRPVVTASLPSSTVRLVAAPAVPVLDRQVAAPTASAPSSARPTRRVVVVHPGDTLWSIAARELGPRATDAQIAAAWPRWYETNAHVIGPDAGTIRPGQHLHVPDASSRTTRVAS